MSGKFTSKKPTGSKLASFTSSEINLSKQPHYESPHLTGRDTTYAHSTAGQVRSPKEARSSLWADFGLYSLVPLSAFVVFIASGYSDSGKATPGIVYAGEPSISLESQPGGSDSPTGVPAEPSQERPQDLSESSRDTLKGKGADTEGSEGPEHANRRIHDQVILKELPRATPTIQKFYEAVKDNENVVITNICGSYGHAVDTAHKNCAGVDIPLRHLPDRAGAKHWFESLDLTCHVHKNGSDKELPLDAPNAHLHCEDKWFVEQHRAKKSGLQISKSSLSEYGITLPNHYEQWKHDIAIDIAKRSEKAGLTPSLAVAAAIAETGITPALLGDHRCSVGVYQWNTCARGPAPEDLIQAWVDEISDNKEEYGGDEIRAVVGWNWPAAARGGYHKESKYYKKVLEKQRMITK